MQNFIFSLSFMAFLGFPPFHTLNSMYNHLYEVSVSKRQIHTCLL